MSIRAIPSRRVCFFLCPNVLGGLEVNAFALARSLRSTRYPVSFVFPWSNPELTPYVPCRVKIASLRDWKDFKQLASWLRSNKIELIQNFGYSHGGAAAASLARIPSVWAIAGFRREDSKSLSVAIAKDTVIQKMALLSPYVTVPSKALEAHFQCIPNFHVERIPYGVDMNQLKAATRPNGRCLQKLLRLHRKNKIVGMVGNFYPEKRHLDFLRAGARICRADPRVRLVIAGNCFHASSWLHRSTRAYQRLVLSTARSLNLEKKLLIAEFSPESRAIFYQAVDVLLSPAREAFGLAMAEAMALGRPVVSVNEGGGHDLIQDHVNGCLVPLGDARQMAEVTLRLLEDERLAQRLGEKSALRIRQHFTIRQQAQLSQALYDRILDSEDRSSGSQTTPYRRRMASA